MNIYSSEPEMSYIRSSNIDYRKKLGQFFTDYEIARFMASWIIGGKQVKTILDPAFGLGVFARAVDELVSQIMVSYQSYEVDDKVNDYAKQFIDKLKIDCHVDGMDYLCSSWDIQFDGIICNPPYLKFHDYVDKKSYINLVRKHTCIRLNGFTNLYVLFLLKSLHQLAPDGRCAFIIPLEFLNSNYGVPVKEFIISEKMLSKVIVFNTNFGQFSEAITTSGIFLFENKTKDELEFYVINSIDEMYNKEITPIKVSYSDLKPDKKWHIYYYKHSNLNLINNHLVPISKYITVSRGIATGANDYFLFSKSKIDEYGIGNEYLQPIITKACYARYNVFGRDEFNQLFNLDKNTHILDISDDYLSRKNSKPINEYIKLGEANGINERYLTKHRTPWFKIERIQPAPIWVSVFTRKGIRFILNPCMIRNLTTFHGVYVKSNYIDKISLIFSYLITPTAQRIIQLNKRQYGDGLDKFEPNDINEAQCLDLDALSNDDVVSINDLYKEYILNYKNDQRVDSILNELDGIFSRYY